MYPDYVKLVMEYYHWKKRNNKLPSELIHPSQARLKNVSMQKCRDGVQNKDEKAIRDFCGNLDSSHSCLQGVSRCEPDKFKPLTKFLKGGTKSTEPKNIPLLAWLIDFPIRPFSMEKDYESITLEQLIAMGSEVGLLDEPPYPPTNLSTPGQRREKGDKEDDIPKNPENPSEPNVPVEIEGGMQPGNIGTDSNKWMSKIMLAASAMLLLALGAGSVWWLKDSNRPADLSNGCMYWANDHYEPVACNQQIPNVRIVALDTVKVKHFRKITTPDTITYAAKGWVWYSKIDGEIEYFTSDGEHPVVFGRRLKPVTDYIIDKYIRQRMTSK